MSLALPEIIFSGLMFCVIWFLIFKFALMINEKKQFKNMAERIEKQDIKTDLINEIKGISRPKTEEKKEEVKPKKIKKKKGFLSKFFKKKKEVKEE